MDLKSVAKFAALLAKKSGRMLAKKKGTHRVLMRLDQRDIVTDLDMDSQKIIVEGIKSRFPCHNILSEESVPVSGKSPYTWIIDPIDGTKHIAMGVPLFSVSIALKHKDKLVVGVVYDPNSKNLFSAVKGKGAFLNGRRIHVSRKAELSASFIYLDAGSSQRLAGSEYRKALEKFGRIFRSAYKVRMLGVGSLGMCYVAMGAFEAFVDITGKVKPWDIAAGRVIAEEAGAKIDFIGQHIVVSNGLIRKELLSLLK